MWKSIVEMDRPQMTIRRMRIAYWINKATNKGSEYVIHIAFQLQHWLQVRAWMLRYLCIAYLVKSYIFIRTFDVTVIFKLSTPHILLLPQSHCYIRWNILI